MKLFMFMRVIAQILDLFVGLLVLVGAFLMVPPFIMRFFDNSLLAAILTMSVAFGTIYLLQLPFMQNRQTIGKAFCGMEIISTDESIPLTVGLIIHREIVLKLMTCYLICIPMLAGEKGGHEAATHTAVVKLPRKSTLKRAKL